MRLISRNVMHVIELLHDLGKGLGCKMAIFENIGTYHRKVVST